MTTAQLIENFSILQDKRESPSLEEDEVLMFLNYAQLERLKRLIPDDQTGRVNFGRDQHTFSNVRRLIYPITVSMTTAGVVSFATVDTALRTASGDGDCSIHRIVNMAWTLFGKTYPVKFSRLNNWFMDKINPFKAGDATAPIYTTDAINLMFDPINTSASITIACMKTPKILTADNSPEWDDSNSNLIIDIALQLASQATRDAELLATVQNSNVSK